MRARPAVFLVASLVCVSLRAGAATPIVEVVAVGTNGSAIVLSSATSTLIYQPSPTAAPIQAKITCLQPIRGPGFAFFPPLPTIPLNATFIVASAVKGGKHYFVSALSFGPRRDKPLQAVVAMFVSTSPGPNPCGAPNVITNAAGVAILD